jgi:hypothetical protein
MVTGGAVLLVLLGRDAFIAVHPAVPPGARFLLAGAAFVSFLGTLALWHLRRAGFYWLAIGTVASAYLNHLYLGASVQEVALVGVARFAILGVLLWRVWSRMD